MAPTWTEHSAVPSQVAEVAGREREEVEYPERRWVAPSAWPGDAVGLAKAALEHHFRKRDDVFVAMEMAVYYERGNNHIWLQPDVMVAFGVGRAGNRSTFRAWDEGKAPDFVMEMASPSAAEKEAHFKAEEYARIGVKESWHFDPTGAIMEAPLEGDRVTGGQSRWWEPVARTDGIEYLRSSVLGLDLRTVKRNGATVLVFRDPRTGKEFHGGLEEPDRQWRNAEDWARAEGNRAATEANRARVLEEKLTIAKHEASVAEHEASVARDELSRERRRIGLLEQRLRDLKGGAVSTGRDSEG